MASGSCGNSAKWVPECPLGLLILRAMPAWALGRSAVLQGEAGGLDPPVPERRRDRRHPAWKDRGNGGPQSSRLSLPEACLLEVESRHVDPADSARPLVLGSTGPSSPSAVFHGAAC